VRIGIFNGRVMPNIKLSKGILNSEGFAFCALADYFKVDLIVESGICNGGSTIILGKYFTEIPIISIDLKTKMEAIIRTSIFHNITIINGDSNTLLPQIIDVFKDKRIVILIDGPKGIPAITLARKCLKNNNVMLVGIHDLFRNLYGVKKDDRVLFDSLKVNKFITDNNEFVEKFGYLDTNNDGTKHKLHDKYVYRGQGYGPTLGVMIKGN